MKWGHMFWLRVETFTGEMRVYDEGWDKLIDALVRMSTLFVFYDIKISERTWIDEALAIIVE